MIPSLINDTHKLMLPEHRHEFHAERPRWEIERVDHMFGRVEQGMTVFDIGAEVGDFTSLYKLWVGPTGEVVPFEPSLPYWPSIRQTWEANGFAEPRVTFAGFVSDVTDLHPPKGDGLDPFSWGWPKVSEGEEVIEYGFRHLAQQADSTPQVSLDAFVDGSTVRPDVIVLDIEGAEYRAIEGARDLLTERKPLLYVSVHGPTMLEWYHRTVKDLLELLLHLGYEGRLLGSNGEDYWFFEAR